MFLDAEGDDPRVEALERIFYSRKEVKVNVLNEKFKDDIVKLDNALKRRLKDVY